MICMSHQPAPQYENPAESKLDRINQTAYWSGSVATAVVAGLAAVLAVVVLNKVLKIALLTPPLSDNLSVGYGFTAFLAGLIAAILLIVLLLSTPAPLVFFGWIVGLVTVTVAALAFSKPGSVKTHCATAGIWLLVGLIIGTTLITIAGRTVRPAGTVPPLPPGARPSGTPPMI